MTDQDIKLFKEYEQKWKDLGASEKQAREEAFDDLTRYKCMTDLFYLGYEVMGLKNEVYRPSNQKVIDPKLHGWMCKVIQSNIDTLLMVPRFHLKSRWVKVDIIRRLIIDPHVRIALYSATSALAKTMLKDVKNMACNPLLMRLFPDVFVDPGKDFRNWKKSTEDMMTIRRDEDEKAQQEEQVEAYGVGANIVGRHFDIHYYDDLVVPDYVSTEAQITKLREWFAYVQAILSPEGIEKMTGTRYHYNDLYGTILDEGFYGDHVYVRQVVEGGKPIYNYFTNNMIKRYKKKMTPYIFSCQFNNNPVAKEDQLFPPPQPEYDVLPEGEYVYYIAIDPAGTTNAWSDYTAFAVGALEIKKKLLYIHECFGVKKTGDELAKILIRLCETYHPQRVGIEYGVQTHLQYIIQNEVSKYIEATGKPFHIPLDPIKVSKQEKYDRISWTLGSLVRGGQVRIKSDLHDLKTQMEMLTPAHTGKDDLVDAASMLPVVARVFGFQAARREEERTGPKLTFSFEEIAAMSRIKEGTRQSKLIGGKR